MIYLIGGAPRVGKSLIARLLAQNQQAKFVATDDLQSAVFDATPEADRASRFPFPGFSGVASENTLTADERVELQMIEARSLEGEVDRIITDAVHDRQSLVMEGVHLLPDHIQKLRERFGGDHVHAIFVGSQDIKRVLDGIAKNTSPNNWMKDADVAVQKQVAEFVVAYSDRMKQEAHKNSLKYVERTTDFAQDTEEIKEQLKSVGVYRVR